jgi:hypothetical protein
VRCLATYHEGKEGGPWRRTVPSTVEDLGGEVLRGSAECVGHVVILHVELAQSKVTEGNVARVIEKDVFRLEITVGIIDVNLNRSDREHLSRYAHR